MEYPIIIACRNASDAAQIREAGGCQSAPAYFTTSEALMRLSDTVPAILIMTSLLPDESAIGLVTKSSIIAPTYTVVLAKYAAERQNLLRLWGSGCMHVLGPNELENVRDLIAQASEVMDELVVPPFFADEGVNLLRDPERSRPRPLHLTFVGSQALMSCSNAVLNINSISSLSMSCVAPISPWAMAQLKKNFSDFCMWELVRDARIKPGGVTVCPDFSTLSSMRPETNHFVICHGHLTKEEERYLEGLSPETRVFQACPEGYVENGGDEMLFSPSRLWNYIVSSLYEA